MDGVCKIIYVPFHSPWHFSYRKSSLLRLRTSLVWRLTFRSRRKLDTFCSTSHLTQKAVTHHKKNHWSSMAPVCLNGVMSYVKWLPGGAKSKNRMWYQLQMSSCITLLHLFLNFRRWIYYCFWYLWSSIFSLSLLFKTKLYALKFCDSRKNIFGIEYFRTRKQAELFVFWNGYT